jgi:hypothetical protein
MERENISKAAYDNTANVYYIVFVLLILEL